MIDTIFCLEKQSDGNKNAIEKTLFGTVKVYQLSQTRLLLPDFYLMHIF
jgi:hypothetical protein